MRVGTVCYATTQGLGYLAKAFYDHGIITDPVIYRHPAPERHTHHGWYPDGTRVIQSRRYADGLRDWMAGLDAMLFFETPFDWRAFDVCREIGTKTILIPMYEWTPTRWPSKPDALFCPSLLDVDYFKDEFPEGAVTFMPVPVTQTWKLRTTAERFLHNAGNVGHREHKGTRELLKALPHVVNPDFRLTVRAQDEDWLRRIVQDIGFDDDRVTIHLGEIPYEALFDDHDVYIAPERQNGLSLPLQESFASGMAVMTTDRYPTNTWLPGDILIPVDRYEKARVAMGCREFDSAEVNPRDIASTIDKWCGENITAYSQMGGVFGVNNSWNAIRSMYQDRLKEVLHEK